MAHKTLKNGGARLERQSEEKRAKNPVDNVAFFNEISAYLELRKTCLEAGDEVPQIPNCLGEKIYMIADILSKKYYFIGYSYRDEMVMDAVINCLKYIDKFDPARTNNPFSYFTQVCFYAFIRRIQAEKKQTYVKAQIVKNLNVVFDELVKHEGNMDEEYHTTMGEILATQADENLERLFGKKPKKAKEIDVNEFDIFDAGKDFVEIDIPDLDVQEESSI